MLDIHEGSQVFYIIYPFIVFCRELEKKLHIAGEEAEESAEAAAARAQREEEEKVRATLLDISRMEDADIAYRFLQQLSLEEYEALIADKRAALNAHREPAVKVILCMMAARAAALLRLRVDILWLISHSHALDRWMQSSLMACAPLRKSRMMLA